MKHRWMRLVTGMLVAGLLLAGCGAKPAPGDAAPPPATPGSGPSGAAPAAPAGADETPAWPREVTDAFGERVVLQAKPARVATLSLGLDETVMALAGPSRFAAIGEIARSPEYSNIAGEAAAVPETMHSDLEYILGLEPDLLLLDGFAQPELTLQARNAGLTIVVAELHESFAGHLETVRLLGHVLGEEARAEALIAKLETRAEALAGLVAAAGADQPAPRVLHLSTSLFVPGAGTTTEDIITRAGGVNAATEIGIVSWDQVSLEKVVEMAPDVIIYDEYEAERLRGELLTHPSLAETPAIVDGRTCLIPSRYLTTLSFWNLRGAEEVARCLWPESLASAEFPDFE